MNHEPDQQDHAQGAQAPASRCPVRVPWLRRLGLAGFLFFLIKGLLWLTVPAAIALWRSWGP